MPRGQQPGEEERAQQLWNYVEAIKRQGGPIAGISSAALGLTSPSRNGHGSRNGHAQPNGHGSEPDDVYDLAPFVGALYRIMQSDEPAKDSSARAQLAGLIRQEPQGHPIPEVAQASISNLVPARRRSWWPLSPQGRRVALICTLLLIIVAAIAALYIELQPKSCDSGASAAPLQKSGRDR